MIKVKKKAVVGMKSLLGMRPGPYPLSFGNYFSLADGTRVLNFWAENLTEAASRFLADGQVEVSVWEWSGSQGTTQTCIISDERIPPDWYDNKLCFTGFGRPPESIVREIFAVLGDPGYELEYYDDPEMYFAKRNQRILPSGALTCKSGETADQIVAELLKTREPKK